MRSKRAAVNRDLPIPGSPESNTTCPSPATAFDQRRSSNSSSSCRPTSSVTPVVWKASKRLSTGFALKTAQARSGPSMPFRSFPPKVLKLKEIANELARAVGYDDHAGGGDALQPCGKIWCFANDGLFLRSTGAD